MIKAKDYTKYNIKKLGTGWQPKSKTVVLIVQDYGQSHTYKEVLSTFGRIRYTDSTGKGYKNNCVVSGEQYKKLSKNKQRYFTPLCDKNGIEFWVNTSWGVPVDDDRDCWGDFVKLSNDLGYKVSPSLITMLWLTFYKLSNKTNKKPKMPTKTFIKRTNKKCIKKKKRKNKL